MDVPDLQAMTDALRSHEPGDTVEHRDPPRRPGHDGAGHARNPGRLTMAAAGRRQGDRRAARAPSPARSGGWSCCAPPPRRSARPARPTPRSTSTCCTATSWCWRPTPAATPITPGSPSARVSAVPRWRPGRTRTCPTSRAVENYIACNTWTRSELVVLIRRGDTILGQIDVDSDEPDPFTPEEEAEVRRVADALAVLL